VNLVLQIIIFATFKEAKTINFHFIIISVHDDQLPTSVTIFNVLIAIQYQLLKMKWRYY